MSPTSVLGQQKQKYNLMFHGHAINLVYADGFNPPAPEKVKRPTTQANYEFAAEWRRLMKCPHNQCQEASQIVISNLSPTSYRMQAASNCPLRPKKKHEAVQPLEESRTAHTIKLLHAT